MAKIEIFAVGLILTAGNTNRYIVTELMKRNGLMTKRMKAVFFEKDVDIEAVAAAKKGDLFGSGEISTVKVAPYEITGADGVTRSVETATLFVPDGDEVEAIMSRKKLSRALAPVAAAPLALESLVAPVLP